MARTMTGCDRWRRGTVGAVVAAAAVGVLPPALLPGAIAPSRELRVCADPNNLPFSNRAQEGFENQIANVIARDLQASVTYTWWAQRRGFVRSTLNAKRCDVVVGIVAQDDQVLTTAPYYRSTYVFVSRKDRGYQLSSFDDPRLRHMKIGLHVIGDDYNSLPPAVALAHRGIVRNVVGYSIYGNYAQQSPPARLIDAVANGDVDVAIGWGPLAGFFAMRSDVPLEVVPVSTRVAAPGIPFSYGIAAGVRHGDERRRARLEAILHRRRGEIHDILRAYGVPLVDAHSAPITGALDADRTDRRHEARRAPGPAAGSTRRWDAARCRHRRHGDSRCAARLERRLPA